MGTAVNKLTLERVQLRPMTQQAIELAASVGVLAALVGVRRRVRRCAQAPTVMTRAWRHGWPGLLEPGASYVLGLLCLSMTVATHAAVIGALEPTFVARILGALTTDVDVADHMCRLCDERACPAATCPVEQAIIDER